VTVVAGQDPARSRTACRRGATASVDPRSWSTRSPGKAGVRRASICAVCRTGVTGDEDGGAQPRTCASGDCQYGCCPTTSPMAAASAAKLLP